jgi:DNA-binding NarL/FixJ family response regulator
MEVVAEAEDGRAAVEQVRTLTPDVVIMDIVIADQTYKIAPRTRIKPAPRPCTTARMPRYRPARNPPR